MHGSHNRTGGLGPLAAALVALLALVWLVAASARAAHVDPKAGSAAPRATGLAAAGGATSADAPPVTRPASNRYAMAGGCYALRSNGTGRFVAKTGDGYAATAGSAGQGEHFRMQATSLGSYLFYDTDEDFLGAGPEQRIVNAERPSEQADWTINGTPTGYTARLPGDRLLAVSGGGELVQGGSGQATRFTFVPARGCPLYPEVEVNASGSPTVGKSYYGDVIGYVDPHVHIMNFDAIGGRIWCGSPWHAFGAPYALVDCADHGAGGTGAALESSLSGEPEHDTTGWPTFNDWPSHNSYTHQQLYYKWLERTYRGGLRIFLNLFNENEVLCRVYPLKKNPCGEMDGVRRGVRRMRELEGYIDAQNGGPGKGWFRIVTNPFEARRVINSGKLAVMMGIETSKLFDCDIFRQGEPTCSKADVDRGLDEMYKAGVRGYYPIHKFDNAFGGVGFDSAEQGAVVNNGQFIETGSFWQVETCKTPEADNEQLAQGGDVTLALQLLLPPGTAPVYPEGPHCNLLGLNSLGEHLIRALIKKRVLIDPDHMSVRSRNRALEIFKTAGYSGVISTHSWSTPQSFPKIFKLGGWVNPISEGSTRFVRDWRAIKKVRDKKFSFGFGYGADTHGLHAMPGPRSGNSGNPVKYPFRSVDPNVTLDRERSGARVWDVNVDGVPHYGLFPDWLEDARKVAGDAITRDLANGAEAFLETWERAVGVRHGCLAAKARVTRRGLGRVRLRLRAFPLLRRSLQPKRRPTRAYRYCVKGKRNSKRKVVAAFTRSGRVALVASTAKRHRARKVGTGAKARRVRRITQRYARGLRIRKLGRSRIVYGLRGGRVRFVAVATRRATNNKKKFRRYLKLAGL